MIYLLLGENSYRALKKIADIKSAFYKKGGDTLAVVEVNGPDTTLEEISESIIAGNLFASRRLVVLKHAIEAHPSLISLIKENAKELAAALGTTPLIVPDAGHFNEKSGYTRFPLLLEKVLGVLKK